EVTVSTGGDGCVQVTDQGPGVPPEDRAHIFERFWRGRGAPAHGAGLGLSIVAEIMKAHGGSVRVDSGEKGRAPFTLAFPLVAPALTPRAGGTRPNRPGAPGPTPPWGGRPSKSGQQNADTVMR